MAIHLYRKNGYQTFFFVFIIVPGTILSHLVNKNTLWQNGTFFHNPINMLFNKIKIQQKEEL